MRRLYQRPLSLFAIDLGEEKSHSLAALRGENAQIIDKQQLVTSNWHIAGKTQKPGTATLCLLGLGLDHPRETQA
jgi:hypothetical protein